MNGERDDMYGAREGVGPLGNAEGGLRFALWTYLAPDRDLYPASLTALSRAVPSQLTFE